MKGFIVWLVIVIVVSGLRGEAFRLKSQSVSPLLVELYTSEGCSSCPPAESWLSAFLDDPDLWTKIVPVAFHVDYWDRLGWKDPFATRENSLRQYRLRDEGAIKSIYTPGFVVDGREWRGWFEERALGGVGRRQARGRLEVVINAGKVEAVYSEDSDNLLLNIAILGMGLKSKVARGENRGRLLKHNFVALAHQEHPFVRRKAAFELPVVDSEKSARWGIALWVVSRGATDPEVVLGNWLPAEVLEHTRRLLE